MPQAFLLGFSLALLLIVGGLGSAVLNLMTKFIDLGKSLKASGSRAFKSRLRDFRAEISDVFPLLLVFECGARTLGSTFGWFPAVLCGAKGTSRCKIT